MKVVIFVLFINASATIINIVYLFTVDKKMLKKKNLHGSKIMRKLYHSVSCFYLLKLTFSISFTFSLSYQKITLVDHKDRPVKFFLMTLST